MEDGYFSKETGRQGIKEFRVISDDRAIMLHAKRVNESYYDRRTQTKEYTNMGWDVYCGTYDPETNNIKPETHKICMRGAQSHTTIFGRLLYTRRFIKATREYNFSMKPSDYEKSVTVWGIQDKPVISERGVKNALFLANPGNYEGLGFPRVKELMESGMMQNPTYYIQYSAQTFKKGKGSTLQTVPLCLACFYDVEGGRKLVIDRLPEYKSRELFKSFFPVIFQEFELYPDTRIFFEPQDELEQKVCTRFMFTPAL